MVKGKSKLNQVRWSSLFPGQGKDDLCEVLEVD